MSDITEQEQQTLNTGRLMRAESDILLPFIETKEKVILGRIVADFRAGKTDFLSHAAELATLAGMKSEISIKIKQAEHIERKLFEGDKK